MKLRNFLAKNYINAIGWNTKGHYVVIESDDWGSIRMKDHKTYEKFLDYGFGRTMCYFDKYDSLESSHDLTDLYETLTSVKDTNGNSAVITPLALSANPNFEEIAKNGKKNYVYELVTETYKRSHNTEKSYELVLQGIREHLYMPQFHGREHLHVNRWMKALNAGIKSEDIQFETQSLTCLSLPGEKFIQTNLSWEPSFSFQSREEIEGLIQVAADGLKQFKDVYGYEASSFCPPCGIIDEEISESLKDYGILGLQCGQHHVPQPDGSLKLVNHKWGDRSKTGQVYWRRNCTFEPSRNQDKDWVDSCMAEIKIAFRWSKPAVINSHRVNFIGSIFSENRDKTLKQLNRLLKEIVKTWPDVQFISSAQLLDLLLKKK